MADRLGAGFVAVIDEIPLRVALRVLSQDLHAVLVRPDRPVRAETEEQRPGYAGRLDFEASLDRQAGAADVVGDADGERSAERRVGQECVSTCSSRWSPYH